MPTLIRFITASPPTLSPNLNHQLGGSLIASAFSSSSQNDSEQGDAYLQSGFSDLSLLPDRDVIGFPERPNPREENLPLSQFGILAPPTDQTQVRYFVFLMIFPIVDALVKKKKAS